MIPNDYGWFEYAQLSSIMDYWERSQFEHSVSIHFAFKCEYDGLVHYTNKNIHMTERLHIRCLQSSKNPSCVYDYVTHESAAFAIIFSLIKIRLPPE